jgi:hypothetical protein
MDTHTAGFVVTPRRTQRLLAAALLASPLLTAANGAHATPTVEREPVRSLEQKTERIVHMDAGSRIEELRVGGQTRRIAVETNSPLPGYQVQPIDPSQPSHGRDSTGGESSWRILQF